MNPKPLKRCRIPAYPTKLQVLADPKLLEKNIPLGWKTGLMAGAVTAFLAVNAMGCTSEEPSTRLPEGLVVAPISEHGDGRAIAGCVVVAPPAFLSEEEAFQVITREMRKHGIEFSEKDVPWDVVIKPDDFPFKNEGVDEKLWEAMERLGPDEHDKLIREHLKGEPLMVDGFDPKRKVAVEFISCWEHANNYGSGTGVEYNFKKVANALAELVGRKSRRNAFFGIFYDPENNRSRESLYGELERKGVENREIKRILKEKREEARQESLKLLREQVKDFVDWLKAQGAI